MANNSMLKSFLVFFNIFLAALLAGTMFGIWIGNNPFEFSKDGYIEQQQNMIRQLNVLMPLLGLFTILITLLSAYIYRNRKLSFISLLIAAAFLIISGMITRFGNQPINEIVMSWENFSIPDHWTEFRNKWWMLHKIRTAFALLALSLIIVAGIRNS